MPGFLLHFGATVTCMHNGQAHPNTTNPRVKVNGGQPITTEASPYTVAGCPFVPPSGNGPCVTAQWIVPASRVKANNVPVLLEDSQAVCAPTGTGLNVAATQARVRGT